MLQLGKRRKVLTYAPAVFFRQGRRFALWLHAVQVSARHAIPTNAIIATLTFTVILSLILVVSDLAFNIIASIGVSAILSSYIVSITTIAYRKISGHKLPKTRFPLGKLGLPINILALCFLWMAFVLVSCSAARYLHFVSR